MAGYNAGYGGYGDSVPPVPVRLTSVKGEKNGASQDGKKKRWFKGGGSSNPGKGCVRTCVCACACACACEFEKVNG